MIYENDSNKAAPVDMIAAVHYQVTALLLEKLQELRQSGEYDASVVSNALKLVKEEDIRAYASVHPLQSIADQGILRELDLNFS